MASITKAVIVHPAFPIVMDMGSPEPALPQCLLHMIASHLDNAQDLCRFEAVCKTCRLNAVDNGCHQWQLAHVDYEPAAALCRDVARDQSLWRRLCMTKFIIPSSGDVESWREMYKFHHNFFYNVLLSQAAQNLSKVALGGQPLRLAVWA